MTLLCRRPCCSNCYADAHDYNGRRIALPQPIVMSSYFTASLIIVVIPANASRVAHMAWRSSALERGKREREGGREEGREAGARAAGREGTNEE